ncbi:MAG: hypothetical protein II464_05140 [Oscillospiraceae bacterium]|nr:hypothetical protein [Oscillospiraceae bacterium]
MLSALDVYLNVIGGLNIGDTASDLAVAACIVSSLLDKTIPAGTVVFGEIGLGGEIRTVTDAVKRVSEAEKLGFTRCVLPEGSLRKMDRSQYSIELIGISNIKDIKKVF